MRKNFSKLAAMVIVVLVIMISTSTVSVGQSPANEPREEEIRNLVAEIVHVNGFLNPDLIFPGDFVNVPMEDGGFVLYEVFPWSWDDDSNGCLTYIARHHLIGDITPVGKAPAAYGPTAVKYVDIEETSSGNENPSIPWWLVILVTAIAMAILFAFLAREFYLRRRNPKNYPPVVKGGLPNNPVEARQTIEGRYGNRYKDETAIEKVERGRIRCDLRKSPRRITVNMDTGTGRRRLHLKAGDLVHRVTLANGKYEYFRTHCGNLVAPIADGQFELPEGWEFVPASDVAEVTDDTPVMVTETEPETEAKSTNDQAPELETTEPEPEPKTAKVEGTEPEPVDAQTTESTGTDAEERTISVEIQDGDRKIKVIATGSAGNMPTKVENGPDKMVVFFPKAGV